SPNILPGPLLDFGASGLYVELCHSVSPCIKNLKMVAENPMEIHYVEVEIIDVNDNSPSFQEDEKILEISESTLSGRRFQLPTARDPDVAGNAIHAYKLNHNEFFTVQIRERGDGKVPYLVLQKSLDRENHQEHKLLLTAVDGGNPPRSGTLNVTVIVLDSNDNHPTFNKNDNEPEIEVTSLSNTVSENAKPGTVVSLISITDKDAGLNGKIICSLTENVPFDLKPSLKDNMYSVVVKQHLDRESISHYDVTIKATDCGQPPLSTFKTLSIDVADVNDNRPEFLNNPIRIYVVENNVPGNPIFTVSNICTLYSVHNLSCFDCSAENCCHSTANFF
uniref:Si:ch73-379j16.2 n=1 Tax=Salarias fasciatus TaxID=181472 RepID=A0A672FL95_SALFA